MRTLPIPLIIIPVTVLAASCARSLPEAGDAETDTGTSSWSSSSGNPPTSDDDTSMTPTCGNGLVEIGETCDAAGESATCDADCTEVVCGDDRINVAAGEQCEDADLAGSSCEALGFDGGTITCGEECTYDTGTCGYLPAAPVLTLSFSPIKQFDFGWGPKEEAEHYQLFQSDQPGSPWVQLGGDIFGESASFTMPLHLRHGASYLLRARNFIGYTDSSPVAVTGSLAEAVGYFKASNTGAGDLFGHDIELSGDGNTLVIAAVYEGSGVSFDQTDESAPEAGAVYVFVRDRMGEWAQQAYLKASNAGSQDAFGQSIALSDDGATLAVGALSEDSSATSIDGDQFAEDAPNAGAVYLFVRDGIGQWSQQAYIKASNADSADYFGASVALSGDGDTLAVGSYREDSDATGIGGNEFDAEDGFDAGAVYVFIRDGVDQWSQQAYVKASNTDSGDFFGYDVSVSGDGDTLVVGAYAEDSAGIANGQSDDSVAESGAAYVFVRDDAEQWSQQAYVKPSNPGADDRFGRSVAVSNDGNTLAIGAWGEDSGAMGIDGDQADDSASAAGAVYVFVRDEMEVWSQQAYVKAPNSGEGDHFGEFVALSGNGDILAVGAPREGSSAIGIGGEQANDFAPQAGAAYAFTRDAMEQWTHRTYVKASNTGESDYFGWGIALDEDGNTLAIGAITENSSATGIGGNPNSDGAPDSGAVYLY